VVSYFTQLSCFLHNLSAKLTNKVKKNTLRMNYNKMLSGDC